MVTKLAALDRERDARIKEVRRGRDEMKERYKRERQSVVTQEIQQRREDVTLGLARPESSFRDLCSEFKLIFRAIGLSRDGAGIIESKASAVEKGIEIKFARMKKAVRSQYQSQYSQIIASDADERFGRISRR